MVSESLTDDDSKTNVENDIRWPVSTYGQNEYIHWSPYTEAEKHTLYTNGKRTKWIQTWSSSNSIEWDLLWPVNIVMGMYSSLLELGVTNKFWLTSFQRVYVSLLSFVNRRDSTMSISKEGILYPSTHYMGAIESHSFFPLSILSFRPRQNGLVWVFCPLIPISHPKLLTRNERLKCLQVKWGRKILSNLDRELMKPWGNDKLLSDNTPSLIIGDIRCLVSKVYAGSL